MLDEGIEHSRASAYLRAASGPVTTFREWKRLHQVYLDEYVHLPNSSDILRTVLDPGDQSQCPDTFRSVASFPDLEHDNDALQLIRVVTAAELAGHAKNRKEDVLDWCQAVAGGVTHGRAHELLESAFYRWNSKAPLTPVAAAFWGEVQDLLPEEAADAPSDWANRLRNRLGLYGFNALPVAAVEVVVLRYPVSRLPKVKDVANKRPITRPGLLDRDFSEAFVPAPGGSSYGYTLDLSEEFNPQQEILHPWIPVEPKDVFRTGVVTVSGPKSLDTPRQWHLWYLREEYGRPDYATQTDSDLQ